MELPSAGQSALPHVPLGKASGALRHRRAYASLGRTVRRGRTDGAHERQSSIAARTRSVTSTAVAFHANGMEISTSGYDVMRTANSRRSGVATIQPSNRLLYCLPAANTAASNSVLRSRGIVAESKTAIGMNSIIAVRTSRLDGFTKRGSRKTGSEFW